MSSAPQGAYDPHQPHIAVVVISLGLAVKGGAWAAPGYALAAAFSRLAFLSRAVTWEKSLLSESWVSLVR